MKKFFKQIQNILFQKDYQEIIQILKQQISVLEEIKQLTEQLKLSHDK